MPADVADYPDGCWHDVQLLRRDLANDLQHLAVMGAVQVVLGQLIDHLSPGQRVGQWLAATLFTRMRRYVDGALGFVLAKRQLCINLGFIEQPDLVG